MDYSQQEDKALLEHIGSGLPGALDELYGRYGRLVYSIALYVTGEAAAAEDVSQWVFARVWEKAEQYDPDRGTVRVWVTTMARNGAIDRLRRDKVRSRIENQLMADAMPLPQSRQRKTESDADLRLRMDSVRSALGQLTGDQRKVLIMAYFHGLTQTEIARELDLPLGTVKTRIRSAIKRLRQLLNDKTTD